MKTLSAVLYLCAISMLAQQPNGAAINPPWPAKEVVSPADFSKQLKGIDALILQVGFEKLYAVKHIPGSVYAGPSSRDLEPLKKAVAGVPKDREIVLYCGCCPWDHCPNMKPAYNLLKSLGYTKIKVMEIPDNFGKDWVEKGYPVDGSTSK